MPNSCRPSFFIFLITRQFIAADCVGMGKIDVIGLENFARTALHNGDFRLLENILQLSSCQISFSTVGF